MVKRKVSRKKRVQVPSPDKSYFYNKPVTRGDTIGLRLGEYEPDHSITEQNDIPQMLIGQPNKKRVLTREMTEFLQKIQVQNLVESDDGTAELGKHNLNRTSNASIQESESKNTPKSNNSSFNSLKKFKGHSFQDTCIFKSDSQVNEPLFEFQEPQNPMTVCTSAAAFNMWATDSENRVKANYSSFQSLSSLHSNHYQDTNSRRPRSAAPKLADSQNIKNQIIELGKGSNINIWMPESENLVKANASSFQSLSSLNGNTYKDICISKQDPSVHEEVFNVQDGISEVCMGSLIGGSSISIQDSGSVNAVKSNNSSSNSSKSLIGQSFPDSIFNPEFRVQDQLIDSQDREKPISQHEKEVICNTENPKSENGERSINSCLHNLNSLNGNLHQDLCAFTPQVQVPMQQVDTNEPEKQINEHAREPSCNMRNPGSDNLVRSNNSYHHNLSCLQDNSYQDNYTSQPHAKVCNQQVHTRNFENRGPELAKGFRLNQWVENAIDSVAAVLLPYVP